MLECWKLQKGKTVRRTAARTVCGQWKSMCVALPGRVLSIKENKAVVDFQGNQVTAEAGLVKVKPGDRVLVHAGCILQVLSEEEGDRMQELFDELEEVMADENP